LGGTGECEVNAAQYFDHWNTVHRDLLRAVAVLTDEDLNFQPSAHYERTVKGILLHIINVEESWIHYVVRRRLPDWPKEDEGLNSVAAIRAKLNTLFTETMDYLSSIPAEDLNRVIQVPDDGVPKLSWILWHVLEQHIHHRGELFLCLSLLGKDRPIIDRP
jgi:uncharacterized damage-inducible protein DinB